MISSQPLLALTSGQVANTRRPDLSNSTALLWNESDLWNLNAARNLGSFGGPSAWSGGINDLGQVVGTATTGGHLALDRAFLFQNKTLYHLNLLASVGKLVLRGAFAINNSGQILVAAQASGGSSVDGLLTPTGQ